MRRPPMPWLKPAVVVGVLMPLGDLAVSAVRGTLGADPIALVLNRFGLLALVVLIASLACTPLKTLFGWTWPVRIRRELGLLGFSYVVLHFLSYALLDRRLAVGAIVEDIAERPFILVGFAAFVLLIPLAVTSTDRMVRRLGFVRWKRLHRLAYLAVALGVVHFFIKVKADVREPLIYAGILAALFAVRVVDAARKRARAQGRPVTGAGSTSGR